MSYAFVPGARYRMPTHFGPSLGPRQGLGDRRYQCLDTPGQTIIRAGFRAEAEQLERFLPPRFSLLRPEIHFTFCYMTDVEWLAGRGYNTFGVSIPARYAGSRERIDGEILLVLWENMADPIISGREELGFSKVYCELPPPLRRDGEAVCRASWDGHQFATLRLSGLGDTRREWPAPDPSEGLLHYKYMPKTGAPGEADAEYAVLTPIDGGHFRTERNLPADGASCDFRHSTWEELPTLVHIVNALAELELGECVEARIIEGRGAKDLSDQRILD